MHPLSEAARFILDRLEPDRRYGVQDLRALVPSAGVERIREIMHELWIQRQVERVGDLGWRRRRSAPPHAVRSAVPDTTPVKPEELFDHDGFAEFFK